jgi:hypothetical protein
VQSGDGVIKPRAPTPRAKSDSCTERQSFVRSPSAYRVLPAATWAPWRSSIRHIGEHATAAHGHRKPVWPTRHARLPSYGQFRMSLDRPAGKNGAQAGESVQLLCLLRKARSQRADNRIDSALGIAGACYESGCRIAGAGTIWFPSPRAAARLGKMTACKAPAALSPGADRRQRAIRRWRLRDFFPRKIEVTRAPACEPQ